MIIYPAIDIKDGCCVRLTQGNYDMKAVYSTNPVEVALDFENKGAKYLHMVDLDGAKTGKSQNIELVVDICSKLKMPVQLGGGIRNLDNIDFALSKGVERVILGTSAVRNKELVKEAINKYGDRIVIGIDAKDGFVAIEGWYEASEYKAVEFGKMMESIGAKTIIYTDISRDGMLSGPNLKAMEEMASALKLDVIASGGVSCLKDIKELKGTGVSGVIVGRALYTGDVDLVDALRIV